MGAMRLRFSQFVGRAALAVGWLSCSALPVSAKMPAEGRASSRAVVTQSELKDLAWRLSVEAGLDPRLVDALIMVESGYNPRALSSKGAIGMMQLMPQTARRLRVDDPYDPEQNVRGGVRELSRLLERYSGNTPLALAAYNAGEGAVAKYGGIPPYGETRRYVARIMYLYTGRPYSGMYKSRSKVRMVKDNVTGAVVITNTAKPDTASRTVKLRSQGALGGGFGR